ncbi:hypothetical protein GCM10027613_19590 [Microlunatus endophyticus]
MIDTFANPWPPRENIKITSVRAITTAPEGTALVVVRIDTDVPGLYGLGCATFTQRWKAVQTYVDEHVSRLLVGRYPGDISDLTRLIGFTAYWRGGPITNNAISGVDQALWDIAGKRAGLPVYELLGGKVRAKADTYLHASGSTIDATIEHAHQLIDRGQRYVRLQISTPGGGGYGAPALPGSIRRLRTRTAGVPATICGEYPSCSRQHGVNYPTTSSCCTMCTRD